MRDDILRYCPAYDLPSAAREHLRALRHFDRCQQRAARLRDLHAFITAGKQSERKLNRITRISGKAAFALIDAQKWLAATIADLTKYAKQEAA